MARKYFVMVASIVFLLLANSSLFAQEPEGHVFVVSTWKVRFDQLEDYLNLFEKEYKPLAAQNEHLKSLRVFTHLFGPDWNVVVIREFENLEAIAKSEKRDSEILEKNFPDPAKRSEYTKKVGSYILAHTDTVVREVPRLRK